MNLDRAAQLDAPIYTVSQLNREVRSLLEQAYPLVWIEGEISNFTHHRSGHMYLTLKDENAQVDAAMFKMSNQRLTFQPEGGMSVLALAQVTVYEPRGRYQIVIQEMRPAGVGKLQLAFEQLKARLQAEGLFDPQRKKPLPAFPERIGIVTAPGAAALRDIHTVLARRYPVADVLLFPARVQGKGAAAEIVNAIERANRYSESTAPLDVLIVGRGGGSLEDLWAFNEEVVVRAIAASALPIVSAVGHEVDVTISDFAADLRAATPSAAAELVVPHQDDVLHTVAVHTQQLGRLCAVRWKAADNRLDWIKRSHGFNRPLQRLRDATQTLDTLQSQLVTGLMQRLTPLQQRQDSLLGRLANANPTAILRRGYAVVRDAANNVVRHAGQISVGDPLHVRLMDGAMRVRVEEVDHDQHHH